MGEGTSNSPYTREDVIRIIEERSGKTGGLDLSGKWFEEGVDLSDLELKGVKFRNAWLFHAIFNGSDLYHANMQNAYLGYAKFNPHNSKITALQRADFTGARLHDAEFREANLVHAKFQETEIQLFENQYLRQGESSDMETASLERTDFRNANLLLTSFKDCYFYRTKFEGAFIRGADIFNAHLEDIDWGNCKIGEENKKDKLYYSVDIYRKLKQWYTNNGLYDIAGKFFYREMEARRKALSWKEKPFYKLWYWILRLLCGYGEQWRRVIIWAASVVLGLAAIYYFWGSFSSSSFLDTLYYSASSFTALGYGQWAPQPIGWAKYMGAIEAFIGVFSMALFLVTFTRKMTR